MNNKKQWSSLLVCLTEKKKKEMGQSDSRAASGTCGRRLQAPGLLVSQLDQLRMTRNTVAWSLLVTLTHQQKPEGK